MLRDLESASRFARTDQTVFTLFLSLCPAVMQRRLGFQCDLVPYAPSAPEYAGFTGFVDAMHDCATPGGDSSACNCDIGIGAWAVSSGRRSKADFPAAFSAEAFRAVTRSSAVRETAAKHVFFLQAFTWPVWVAIAGLMLMHVLVLMMDRGFAPAPQRLGHSHLLPTGWQLVRYRLLKSAMLYRLRTGLISTTVHFMGQYAPGSRKLGTKTRLMNVIALMMGVFLLTMFQASVTVQVLGTQRHIFRSHCYLHLCL